MKRAVVFDLDGTLIDSLPDIVASFLRSFDVQGLERPPEEAVRLLVGKPLGEMYGAFAPADVVPGLVADYRSYYPLHFTDSTRPFPGVFETLAGLRSEGYALAVATTKRSDIAVPLVRALGLDAYLDHVQGTDGFPHKPAPDVIHRALAACGASGVCMVGDTVGDVLAGKAAGLATYAVTWGTHGAEELARVDPDVVAPDLSRLHGLIARSA